MQRLLVLVRIVAWRGWIYLRRRPWTLAIGLALLALELFVPRDISYWMLVGVTALIIVKGVVDIIRPAYDDVKQTVALKPRLRPGGPILFGYVRPYDRWETIATGTDHAVHDPELDTELTHNSRIRLQCNEQLWLPSGEHEQVRKLKASTLDFDEDKVRLETDLLAGANSLQVRRTPYSAFLVTNRLASYEYRKKGSQHELLPFGEVGVDDNGLIPRLPRSRCSNHIGVDVLAIADGRILLQRQSERNQLNKGKIVGSGSGSVDWRDLSVSDSDLSTFVRYSMRREMVEELGLSAADEPTLEDIRVVGYSRLTSLGGKPQFYGIARLGTVAARIRGREVLYVEEHYAPEFDPADGVMGLRTALDRIEATYRDELSFPLYVNIQMVRQWLDADPSAAAWLGLAIELRR